ncbi:unnamed protein product [Rotaria socialis]
MYQYLQRKYTIKTIEFHSNVLLYKIHVQNAYHRATLLELLCVLKLEKKKKKLDGIQVSLEYEMRCEAGIWIHEKSTIQRNLEYFLCRHDEIHH